MSIKIYTSTFKCSIIYPYLMKEVNILSKHYKRKGLTELLDISIITLGVEYMV